LERQLELRAAEIKKLESELEKAKQEGNQAARFADRLLQEQSQLQQRIGRGDYDPTTTKVRFVYASYLLYCVELY